MKQYQHLFFDLDGTLWDLRKNTLIALREIFDEHADTTHTVDFDLFYRRYHHHNDRLWALYRDGRIDKESLRIERFQMAFEECGVIQRPTFYRDFADAFLVVCPRQPHAMEGAHRLLDHCKGRYRMHIITNGFSEVQGIKMAAAQLDGYFEKIIFSESCGIKKPHKGIFEHAFQCTGATAETSLMIGDDWDADIIGARGVGMDQAFLVTTEALLNEINKEHGHKSIRHNTAATFTLQQIDELIEIL
ncbi:MAG: YjjG family noncanonical pyrimidine nucleotidase [Flavobacteriales bacterium]